MDDHRQHYFRHRKKSKAALPTVRHVILLNIFLKYFLKIKTGCIYWTFAVQMTFKLGCEQQNTHKQEMLRKFSATNWKCYGNLA